MLAPIRNLKDVFSSYPLGQRFFIGITALSVEFTLRQFILYGRKQIPVIRQIEAINPDT